MLSLLPVGQQRGERPELFASDQMVRAMQNLGRRFADRLVILDVAPCLSTSDPATLAPVVGQILFVIEAERTQRDEVEASLDLIQTCPTITLLLEQGADVDAAQFRGLFLHLRIMTANRWGRGDGSRNTAAPLVAGPCGSGTAVLRDRRTQRTRPVRT